MKKILYKIGLGLAVALLICLLPMPYGYYTLVRFAAMIILGCMAYGFYKEEKQALCIIAGSLALLFQPLIKITLDRITWNIVDVLLAISLVALWYKNEKDNLKK